MTKTDEAPGYDVIGDIHGCATKLESLLAGMGYTAAGPGEPYRHPTRTAIYVGDLIDRGDEQLLVLQIVTAMVDAGTARMVLGNHEFNAMAYATEWPEGSGRFLRPHDDPTNRWSAKNEKQHRAFLEQVRGDDRVRYVDWFWTQPLWLDLGDIRVVHACWHSDSMDMLRRELGGDRLTSVQQLRRASTEGDPVYEAVETLLKGPEISLTHYGQAAYRDKDGISRGRARVQWWNGGAYTLRGVAEMSSGFTQADGTAYPALPDIEVAAEDRSFVYSDQILVFYGHYWRSGEPEHGKDWTDYTACVDFSAVKGGKLTAYRWSGEKRVLPENFVSAS